MGKQTGISMIKPASVVSVRGRKPDVLRADSDFVYVGRWHPAGWPKSKWANPFRSGMSREEAVMLFYRLAHAELPLWELGGPKARSPVEWFGLYLRCRDDLLGALPELAGKRLGCWCGEWSDGQPDIGCHAVVLAKLANKLARGGSL